MQSVREVVQLSGQSETPAGGFFIPDIVCFPSAARAQTLGKIGVNR